MRVTIKKLILLPVVALLASITLASPASAAVPQGATVNGVTSSGCAVYLDVTFQGPGTYRLQAWDDGTKLFDQAIAVKGRNHRRTLVYVVTAPILQGAAGLGLYITDSTGTTFFDGIEDFDFEDPAACPVAYPVLEETGAVAVKG